jgi:DSF synthase
MHAIAQSLTFADSLPSYQQLTPYYDAKHQIAWCYLQGAPRPCFSAAMLTELNHWCAHLRETPVAEDVRFHVTASAVPGVYNLGGDLSLFLQCITRGDRDALYAYGRQCIDVLHANMSSFGRDLTTIALVQGEALGGGFEGALSAEVLIAERGARMGFPEILFNLFPGMGAYSFLSRRIGPKRAERMILSGKVYPAEELYEMGLIDELAEDGFGEEAVYAYIRRESRARNGYRALRRARDRVDPVSYRELDEVLQVWVDAAMQLEPRDLRMIERLVARQNGITRQAA